LCLRDVAQIQTDVSERAVVIRLRRMPPCEFGKNQKARGVRFLITGTPIRRSRRGPYEIHRQTNTKLWNSGSESLGAA
jgi:hypothetical protein